MTLDFFFFLPSACGKHVEKDCGLKIVWNWVMKEDWTSSSYELMWSIQH